MIRPLTFEIVLQNKYSSFYVLVAINKENSKNTALIEIGFEASATRATDITKTFN